MASEVRTLIGSRGIRATQEMTRGREATRGNRASQAIPAGMDTRVGARLNRLTMAKVTRPQKSRNDRRS